MCGCRKEHWCPSSSDPLFLFCETRSASIKKNQADGKTALHLRLFPKYYSVPHCDLIDAFMSYFIHFKRPSERVVILLNPSANDTFSMEMSSGVSAPAVYYREQGTE